MGRLIGLDVGDKRIGIAVSDETRLIASPRGVYTRAGYGPDTRYFSQLHEQLRAEGFVLGLPRNMDGSEGFQAQKAREFGSKLQEAGFSVQFWDERLSTASAQTALLESGMRRDRRKMTVDSVAAALILQSWLDAASGGMR